MKHHALKALLTYRMFQHIYGKAINCFYEIEAECNARLKISHLLEQGMSFSEAEKTIGFQTNADCFRKDFPLFAKTDFGQRVAKPNPISGKKFCFCCEKEIDYEGGKFKKANEGKIQAAYYNAFSGNTFKFVVCDDCLSDRLEKKIVK